MMENWVILLAVAYVAFGVFFIYKLEDDSLPRPNTWREYVAYLIFAFGWLPLFVGALVYEFWETMGPWERNPKTGEWQPKK